VSEVAELALQNKRLLYGLLFEAASQTLREVAADPRHLGARQLGVLAVLHTWGQTLMHHPHLHCVVSGGGLSQDGAAWIASRRHYFLPVRVLSRVFRNRRRRLLQQAYERGEVQFHGQLQGLAEPAAFRRWLAAATGREWVVYAKRPFGSPELVLKYLARYTHRVAISNNRLVKYQSRQVTFRYKDYAHGGQGRSMTLTAHEFIRRFLMHVLPEGFMRIRHYGYLANRRRGEKLALCRQLLGALALERRCRPERSGGRGGGPAGAERTNRSLPSLCERTAARHRALGTRRDRPSPAACDAARSSTWRGYIMRPQTTALQHRLMGNRASAHALQPPVRAQRRMDLVSASYNAHHRAERSAAMTSGGRYRTHPPRCS